MRTALQEMAGAFTLRTGSSLHLLINRLVLGLVALLLAFSFLNGLSSWLVSVDSVGITTEEIINNNLPLPFRDFVPVSVEEQIICFADKFYSKSGDIFHEKSVTEVRKSIRKFGEKNLGRFNEWCEIFL